MADVLVGQARSAFERKDFQKAETYLLRAERPDLAAKFYTDADMWSGALRIVKEYLPHKLDDFQRELAAKSGKNYSSGTGSYVGAEWGVLPCNRLLPAAHYTELPRPRPPTGHVGEGC